MASIFFTERLPGVSILQTAALLPLHARQVVRLSVLTGSRAHAFIAGEHDDPEPLPQKQGLCQVGDAPDFETLSDF
jgi:hypothetical protein